MSYVFNMVGGSSGGGGPTTSDAILTVTVPTGSTVTMTKGGVTLTPTMWVQAADNTLDCALFVIQPSLFDAVNAWTVTATRGTDTASKTIIIDAAYEYNLIISLHVPIETYQEVEYLESTGGTNANAKQYINVNHTTSGYIRIKSKFAWIAGNIYFAKQGYNSGYPLGFNMGSENGNYFQAQIAGSHNGNLVVNTSQLAVSGAVHELDFNARASNPYISIDGNVVLEYTTGSVSYVNAPIYIFAGNTDGNPSYYGNYRLYNWIMYDDNGNIIREYYPCYRRADSVAGLYDKTNNVFYTNSGTGTFIVGADV